MDWKIALKMAVDVLLYVLVTAALWRLCKDRRPFRTRLRILIGVVFGACSVLSTHIGIPSHDPVLNVRDISPLAAGLFFSPLSGVIAGVIGGGERLLAGEIWNIGRFTEVACSLSTCLAGFLAAALNKWIYKGKHPSVPQAFILGGLTEVFHMYAVLFTNRGSMASAYSVVRLAAVPMIAFTAVGTALCAITVKKISGERLKPGICTRWKEIPISKQVQCWLLAATVVMFLYHAVGSYRFLSTVRDQTDACQDLESVIMENTLSDILLFTIFYVIMSLLAEHLVVKNLKRIKTSLNRISKGRLDEKVQVRTSPEFSSLSDDINKTVTTLKEYIDASEKRMENDLKLAAAVQDSALPKHFNRLTEAVDLYALMTPARQVGGDFYDFFSVGPDQLCLVIADVSGKGIPASLFMMRAKTAIRNHARNGQGPAELMMNVNSALCEENSTNMFVTVWLGMLDLKTGRMRCCNAGHEFPALLRVPGNYELLSDEHGSLLGVFDDVSMAEYELRLNPGDRLFVYTDGVPDTRNEKKERYGMERLIGQLNQLKDSDQKAILEGVLQDLRSFTGAAERFDDITILGLTYLGR